MCILFLQKRFLKYLREEGNRLKGEVKIFRGKIFWKYYLAKQLLIPTFMLYWY